MAKKIKGIDVSRYQGSIDFNKVKAAGIEFVMMRCGTGYRQNACKDVKFETYYKQAKAAGLKVGTYFYSYALTEKQARTEAAWVLDWIKGKRFEYPVVFDIEDKTQANLGVKTISNLIRAFCEIIEDAGYFVSVYSNLDWLRNRIDADCKSRYDIWLAQWASKPTYTGQFGMWQYSATGNVNGISGPVDLDIAYKDYPTIIKAAGLNGFPKTATKPAAKPTVPAAPVEKPAPKPVVLKAGDKVTLNGVKLYSNYKTAKAQKQLLTGTYYIYDGVAFGNRYRITNSAKRVNKKPAGLFVTGYVDKEDLV